MENKLKMLREKLGITQKGLAQSFGITRQTIYLIEVGKYNYTIKLSRSICKEYRYDLNTHFG